MNWNSEPNIGLEYATRTFREKVFRELFSLASFYSTHQKFCLSVHCGPCGFLLKYVGTSK